MTCQRRMIIVAGGVEMKMVKASSETAVTLDHSLASKLIASDDADATAADNMHGIAVTRNASNWNIFTRHRFSDISTSSI